MLRLLAQREQGYEDIAALMGLSVSQVRDRVKDALDQLEEDRAAAPSVASREPAAPQVPPPAAAAKPVEPAPAPAPAPSAPPSRPAISIPRDRGARAALGAGALAVVVLIVLLASGAFGGDDSGGDATSAASTTESTAASDDAGSGSKEVTQAILNPVDDSDASGSAVFGRVKNSLALQIEAEGLEPTKPGESYTFWLARSPSQMLPLASTKVGQDGKVGAQVEVPTEVLGYLASGTFDQITVSRTADATLKASLAKATSEKKPPLYTGAEVLRGTVTGPIVGAAKRAE
jgi:hypothetical protein